MHFAEPFDGPDEDFRQAGKRYWSEYRPFSSSAAPAPFLLQDIADHGAGRAGPAFATVELVHRRRRSAPGSRSIDRHAYGVPAREAHSGTLRSSCCRRCSATSSCTNRASSGVSASFRAWVAGMIGPSARLPQSYLRVAKRCHPECYGTRRRWRVRQTVGHETGDELREVDACGLPKCHDARQRGAHPIAPAGRHEVS